MRQYLSTLHKRSDRHKKNFALAVSGGFTLFIFVIWFAVHSGTKPVVADNSLPELAAAHEAGPLESLGNMLSSMWKELTSFDFNGR